MPRMITRPRGRKSFTLLELMVAFIIMAILSAIAVPSLLGIVHGDQLTADATSAGAIVDAAYYTAASGAALPNGHPSYFPIDAAEVLAFVPAGTHLATPIGPNVCVPSDPASYDYGIVDCTYGDPVADVILTFTDGDTIYVTAPQSGGSGVPNVLGGTAPNDGGVVGKGANGTYGGSSYGGDPSFADDASDATTSTPTSTSTSTSTTTSTTTTSTTTTSTTTTTLPSAVDITTAADNAIAVSPDGDYAYATDGSNVYKIRLSDNTVVATLSTGFNGDFIIVNPAGTKAYIADSGGYAIGNKIGVVDLSTFTMDTPITTSGYDPAGLAINASGTRLYVLENWPTGAVAVIDLSDGSTVATVTDPGGISFIRGIGIDPDGNYLYVENGGDIAAIDLSTNTVATTGAYSSSDTIAYVALRGLSESAGPDVLLMVDEGTGGYSTAASPSPSMTDLVVSPTGGYAYGVSGNDYYEIDLYPLSTTELGSITGGASALDVNPAGTKIYVVKTSGGVREVPVP